MSELPKGWREEKLSLCVKPTKGKKPKILQEQMIDGFTPYIDIKAFELGMIRQYAEISSSKLTTSDDILMVWDGARSGLVGKGFIGAIGSTIVALKPINILKEYLYYFLLYKYGYIKTHHKGTGIPHVDPHILWDIDVPIPPTLDDQKQIVERIEILFSKINNANKRLKKIPTILKRFRQSVLYSACSGQLTAYWRELNVEKENTILRDVINYYKNASQKDKKVIEDYQKLTFLNIEIENSKWIKCNIGAIGKVSNGSTPSTKESSYWNGNIPWVSSGEVRNNLILDTERKITEIGYNNASVKMLKKGTVLIAMIGEGKTRGQSAILDIEATVNQNIAAVDLGHGSISSKYLWYWFQLCYQQNREAGNGSGPKALNCERVRELDLLLPPFREQEEIVRRVDKLFIFADKIEQRYKNAKAQLERAEKAIYAKTFRGELVKQGE